MPSAEEIITANAEKVLKNLDHDDKEVVEAHIRAKVERGVQNLRTFDNVLIGGAVILGLATCCMCIWLLIILISTSSNHTVLLKRVEAAEAKVLEVDEGITNLLNERDSEALQQVKTECFNFCGRIP